MKSLALALSLVSLVGCATVFNKKEAHFTVTGGTIDGQTSVTVDSRKSHVVQYADGHTCTIEAGVEIVWIILDIFTTGPIGLIIDGVTGNWKAPDSDCPGVGIEYDQ